MNKGPRSFRHETIAYERPSLPYRCGRGTLWRKTCWQGPDVDGACRGRFECAPALIGERWQCRRPKLAGGKCDAGPHPDGTCAHAHPPCAPRRSLRSLRGHLSLLAALALVIGLFIGVDPTAVSVVNPLAVDPGDLTSVHAGFTKERGCASCHAAHEQSGLGWVFAAFGRNDPSSRCLECHDFKGPAMRAHNTEHPKRPEVGAVSCSSCHTEHRGAGAKIAQVPDFICANCHQKSFDKFAGGHVPFPEGYPFARPANVYFDHAKHMRTYFNDPTVRRSKTMGPFANAAKGQCTACHAVEGATREVSPKPYGETCAVCHDRDIGKAEFALFEPETVTPVAAALVGEADEAAAMKRLAKVYDAMARKGADGLIEELAGDNAVKRKAIAPLFAGMPSQAARDAGAAFAAKRAPPEREAEGAGWFAGNTSETKPALYLRAVHADPVLKAWIEQMRAQSAGKENNKLAGEALEHLLAADGPGKCGMCHGSAMRLSDPVKPSSGWSRASKKAAPHTRYSHAPHLGLVDPEAGCRTCHELNPDAKYARYFTTNPPNPGSYQSGFLGIKVQACVQCHREGQVNAACQVCHAYHLEHSFNLGFRTRGTKK